MVKFKLFAMSNFALTNVRLIDDYLSLDVLHDGSLWTINMDAPVELNTKQIGIREAKEVIHNNFKTSEEFGDYLVDNHLSFRQFRRNAKVPMEILCLP